MSKLITLIVLTFLLTACVTKPASINESLDWDVGNYVLVFEEGTGWKGVDGKETKNRIYSVPEATQENWTITLNVTKWPIAVTFMSPIRWTPESILNAEKNSLAEKGCTDPWTIIQSDTTSILYERTEVNCTGYLHQYELGRVVVGKSYSWWLRYRIRNRVLTDSEENELVDHLVKAKVIQ